ncbi:MAG: hypothetical protein P4L10_17530 [Acidobacteriaceae bacterium]|nr:hypothetical protein [Acidobacteriaceae bacterium]
MFIRKGQTSCEYPKPLYFQSDLTFLAFKTYIIHVFKFMNGKQENAIRLWRLLPQGCFNEFMHFYRSQLAHGKVSSSS